MAKFLFTGTILILLLAIYQYYGIYHQLNALQSQCSANEEKTASEVKLLQDTLRTRAQEYLNSFKKQKDEFEAKDRESYLKIQDLMQAIDQEKDYAAKSQASNDEALEKLLQSESAKAAAEQDRTNLQNERDQIDSQRSSLQQQLNGQVAQLQECQNREADVARQLQEALNAKQALEAAQAAQAAQ